MPSFLFVWVSIGVVIVMSFAGTIGFWESVSLSIYRRNQDGSDLEPGWYKLEIFMTLTLIALVWPYYLMQRRRP